MRIPTEASEESGSPINLAPLIDVVFLLLIFFMVTATFQNDEREMTIKVPEARNSDPIRDLPQVLVVGVREDGTFRVGGRSLSREDLRRLLVRAKRKNKDQKVIVRGDRDVPLRYPMMVLDLCKGIGNATSMATTVQSG